MTSQPSSHLPPQRKVFVTLSGVNVDDKASLKAFIDNIAECKENFSTNVEARQRARIAYLLMIGLDVPARNVFVNPSNGHMWPSQLFCNRMHNKLVDISKDEPTDQQGGLVKGIINLKNLNITSLPDVRKLFQGTLDVSGIGWSFATAVSYLSQYMTNPWYTREIAVMGAFSMVNSLMRAVAITKHWGSSKSKHKVVTDEQIIKELLATAEKISFPTGLTHVDKESREKFRQTLVNVDREVYQLKNTSVNTLLKEMLFSRNALEEKWRKALHIITEAYQQCSSARTVEATRCMRKHLMHDDVTQFYRASAVFDTSGRLRDNDDMIRAIYVFWRENHPPSPSSP